MDRTPPPRNLPELPPALTGSTGYLSVVIGQRSQELFEAAMAPLGLKPVHYDYLVALAHGGPMAQKDIAHMLEIDAGRIVALTDELEQRSLVERTVDPGDRRRNVITLTRAGRTLFIRAGKIAASVEDDLLRNLTAQERKTLRTLLRKALDL